MKVQKIISLDQETARLASMKSNFSSWVRNQLRSERNKREGGDMSSVKLEMQAELEQSLDMSTARLLDCLSRKSREEIKILVQLLKNSLE